MNVKVANKYASLLVNLEVDFIKSVEGAFTPEEIILQFSNFFFNKMILDITAIKDYQDITKIQELSVNMDMSKVILLLDDSEIVNSPRYLSQLVSMGIYNFTRNIDAIKFLIDNPNVYKDVAQFHQLNTTMVMETTKEDKNDTENSSDSNIKPEHELRIIGIKNVTEHAGSTTFTYLLKKQLEKKYNVLAVEVDENDFVYFNDKSLKNVAHTDLQTFITSNYEVDVILVDLNEHGPKELCQEVLYLIEPGLIKLNKLIRKDRRIFEKLKGQKIILNRSVLNNTDVSDFEYESHSKIYYNIPYLDDKLESHFVLDELLIKMGFVKLDTDNSEKGGKLFSIFK